MSAETVATAEPPRHASLEDKMKELDSVPLFMRDLPTEENTALEALAVLPNLRTVWMQIGVRHEGAAAKAEAAGKTVVQDKCPKIEFPR